MYTGSGFSDWEIGDITVIIHDRIYHLFHLIIPNHDYIAHAVSRDGISWKRVNNALFVGNPGEWDDDMLWTMHVVEADPSSKEGGFEMYYTGLQRRDRGVISRIGFAKSKNLIDWEKDQKDIYPISPKGIFYESEDYNPRQWLSFRDPFKFNFKGDDYLLVCARTLSGPVSRRGCAGLIKITNDVVQLMPPLVFPMVYDDVECPCIFELHDRFYVIGSIREDIKVRYWFSPEIFGPYHSFHSDVLLPQGNYAARIVWDGDHLLLYNFFYAYGKIDALRVLPPPKQLDTDKDGRLLLKTYYRWNEMATDAWQQNDFGKLKSLLSNPTASCTVEDDKWICGSRSGYEIFAFARPSENFIWEGRLTVEGMGKLGLVSDMDHEGNGYFISFDVKKGTLRIRGWGFNPLDVRQNFIFKDLQYGVFEPTESHSFYFMLIRYGNYIELSMDGEVKLTLMDYAFNGPNIGLYSASSVISLQDSCIRALPEIRDEYASQEQAGKLKE